MTDLVDALMNEDGIYDSNEEDTYYCNLILSSGQNLISECTFIDDHSITLLKPIEIIKRVIQRNDSLSESITTSPYLLMVDNYYCTLPTKLVASRKTLSKRYEPIYNKLADQYYMDISELSSSSASSTGTIH
jgi:hypothetical protein